MELDESHAAHPRHNTYSSPAPEVGTESPWGSLLLFHSFCHGWLWDLKNSPDRATALQTSWMLLTQHFQKKLTVRTTFFYNLPKDEEAPLPLLAQVLEYFSLICLQETTSQLFPLPRKYLHHSLPDPRFYKWLVLNWNQARGFQISP